jgi:TolB-like protein/DNA-binding winged helix-turn-helix (wHTH) protein
MTNSDLSDFSNCYEFSGFVLDPAVRELRSDGMPVPVERRVMDLLVFLIERRNRMVGKDEIQDAVWPGTIVTETALTRAIMKARRAVGDNADEQSVIRTVHGEGYRFVADVKLRQSGAQVSRARWPKASFPAIAILVLLIAIFAVGVGIILRPLGDGQEVGATRPVSQPVLAVLPFENLSPNPEHAYFASGIHEEILNEIARGTSLPVMARTSVVQYAGTTKTIPVIANELGVTAILEGSVRYTDNRVRITTQLIDGGSGVHLWSDSYDRDFADIFNIQSDIARKIATALEVEILGSGGQVATSQESVQAYKEYLLARNLRYRTFEVGWDPVLEHIRKSLSYDSAFIPSLGILHNAYQNRIIGESHEDAHREMLAITARAVQRDPNHAVTLSLRAKDAAYQWQWQAAQTLWERALAADPGDPDNLGTAAFIIIGAGDYARAREIIRQGTRLNPSHDWAHYADMLLALAESEDERFVEVGELIISMGGNRAFPAAATLIMYGADHGDSESVVKYGKTVIDMTDGALTAFVAVLEAHARGERITRAAVDQMLAASPPPNTYKWMGTQLYLMANDRDMAFATLTDIVDSRALFSVLRIVSDPAFTPMWTDPRFKAFLSRIGLPDRRG